MKRAALLGVAGFLFAVASARGSDASWQDAQSGYAWSFPRDHWSHPAYQTEWWYLTGNLVDRANPTRRFGYQFTIFRLGVVAGGWSNDAPTRWDSSALVMGHAAITDLASGRHVFSETLYRESPLLAGFGVFPDPRLAWTQAPPGSSGTWSITWNGRAFDIAMTDDARGIAFSLHTRPVKPLVFQGPGGLSRKSPETRAASLYYSFTRLATDGWLRVSPSSETVRVNGLSWMDKEFSTSMLARDQKGWDWFSLQLTDGRELMLYLLRAETPAGQFASGTLVGTDGAVRYLSASDFTVSVVDSWRNPAGVRYPARWTVQVPSAGISLLVIPALADQENRSERMRGIDYWEGAVRVESPEGTARGQGYVELTGYAGRLGQGHPGNPAPGGEGL